MKITIDREHTEAFQMERTKEQVKEFKAIYTDGDLRRMFLAALDMSNPDNQVFAANENHIACGDIVYCNLEAFACGYSETSETHYMVSMLIESVICCIKLYFFISQNGVVSTEPVYGGGKAQYTYRMEKYLLTA